MKVATTIAAISLFFTSALEALTIVSPAAGSTYGVGGPVSVLISNGLNETFTSALVTFASPCGNWIQTVPIGNTQIINLPCNVIGQTSVAAQSGVARSDNVLITISPVCNIPSPIPYAPCANPCMNPCGAVACPPRTSCNRRSRRGCGYYAEDANSSEELEQN